MDGSAQSSRCTDGYARLQGTLNSVGSGLLFSWNPDHHNKTPGSRIDAIEARDNWRSPPPADLDQLLQLILAGHGWCGAALAPGPSGRIHRDQQSVAALNLIVLDIDGDWTLDAFWASPFAQRHCLATATTCSHTPESHRFRAIFQLDKPVQRTVLSGEDNSAPGPAGFAASSQSGPGSLLPGPEQGQSVQPMAGPSPDPASLSARSAAAIPPVGGPSPTPPPARSAATSPPLAGGDIQLLRYLHAEVIDRLDLGPLKDTSGSTPQSLWFGNTAAVIQRNPSPQLLPWELIDDARTEQIERTQAEAEARVRRDADRRREGPEGYEALLQKVIYALDNILPVTADGEYNELLVKVYMAAASSGDERVWDAFARWHSRGHHARSKRNNLRRLERGRHRAGKASDPAVILKLTAERVPHWRSLLPQHLQSSPPSFASSSPTLSPIACAQGAGLRPVFDGAINSAPINPGFAASPQTGPGHGPACSGVANSVPGPAGFAASSQSGPTPLLPEPEEGQPIQPVAGPSPDPTPVRSAATSPPVGGADLPLAGWGVCAVGVGVEMEGRERERGSGGGGGGRGNGGSGGDGEKNEWEGYLSGMIEIVAAMHNLETNGMAVYKGHVLTAENDVERYALTTYLRDQLMASKYLNRTPATIEVIKLMYFRYVNKLPLSYEQCETDYLNGEEGSVKWLIPRILPRGHSMLIHAKQGAGKTTLALQLVRALTGDPAVHEFLDSGALNLWEHWRRSRVLFVASDMGRAAKGMMNQYCNQLGWKGQEFLEQLVLWAGRKGENGSPGTSPWVASNAGFQQLFDELNLAQRQGMPYVAVIIDSMKSICPPGIMVGSQEFKHVIDLATDICAQFDVALIWVHHSANDGSSQGIKFIAEQVSTEVQLSAEPGNPVVKVTFSKVRGAPSRVVHAELRNHPNGMPRLVAAPLNDVPPQTTAREQREDVVVKILEDDRRQFLLKNSHLTGEDLNQYYRGMKSRDIRDSTKWQELMHARAPEERMLQRCLKDLLDNRVIERLGGSCSVTYRLSSDNESLPSEVQGEVHF